MPARILAVVALAFCACVVNAGAASPCLSSPPGESERIVRVETNGGLVLANGREAVLEGILLPSSARDRSPPLFETQAIQRLTKLATAQLVTLAAVPPIKDRYGRIRAQVLLKRSTSGSWLQDLMLSAGLARVFIASDRRECTTELYGAEQRARSSRLGIWSSAAYRVRSPAQIAADRDTFQIVQGRIGLVMHRDSRLFLEFADAVEAAAVISSDDLRNFHRIGVDPFAYQGHEVRVRGWIEQIRGRSELELATPDDVEVIDVK